MRFSFTCALLACGLWLIPIAGSQAAGPEQQGFHLNINAGANTTERSGMASIPVARSKDLVGLRVYNASNEDLGKIEDLVVDPASGTIRYGVLSFGGFLGMGNKLFAVPWQDLKLISKGTTANGTQKEDYYVLDMNKTALKEAPGFDKNNWPNFADPNWSRDTDRFYNAQRPANKENVTR